MKMDQVAFYAFNDGEADEIKAHFGLLYSKWIHDEVTAKSYFPGGKQSLNKALLQFNYDLGIELEIIRYIDGHHWHNFGHHSNRFISHIGLHLAPEEDFPATSWPLVQETFTISHTSEYLTIGEGKGRKYHYRIHELSPYNYIKYIKRINP